MSEQAPLPDAPAPPYRVEMVTHGYGGLARPRPTKIRDGRPDGEILTDEEVALWDYVRHLEAENAKLRADLETLTAPASPAAPDGGGKKKGGGK